MYNYTYIHIYIYVMLNQGLLRLSDSRGSVGEGLWHNSEIINYVGEPFCEKKFI